MGLSVAASSAILFVGFLFVATALFTGLNMTLNEVQDSYMDAYDNKMDFARTHIRLNNATNNTTHLFMNVTNRGFVSISLSELQLLINGSLRTTNITNISVDGENSTDIWAPDEVLYLEVLHRAQGQERIKIICGNGVSDVEKLT